MCTSFFPRLLTLALGTSLTACGGGSLTLPDDGSPARLQVISGSGQEGMVGSRLDDPLVARLTDASARPVAGAPVEFRFQGDVPEGEVDPSNTVTDRDGLASAEVRLGTDAGPNTVEARLAAASAPELRATFDLTALAREDDEDGEGGKGKGGKGKGGNDDGDD